VPLNKAESQAVLLASLHCHCTQLLVEARDQLPLHACGVGQRPCSGCRTIAGPDNDCQCSSKASGSSSDSADATGSCSNGSCEVGFQGGLQQQRQQREAWQLCLAQVQRNLLLVMQLTKHWQRGNASGGVVDLLSAKLYCVQG
jgi:hypothetical protein